MIVRRDADGAAQMRESDGLTDEDLQFLGERSGRHVGSRFHRIVLAAAFRTGNLTS
jgi:hypothetical protein